MWIGLSDRYEFAHEHDLQVLDAESLALLVPVAACDDDDDGDESAGDSANESGNEGGMTSSSEETCQSMHSCLNGVCQCDTPTLEGMDCTDDDECVDECEICM